MECNENNVLELFFNYSMGEWRFGELLKETGIARSKLDGWLKKFQKEKLIRRIKKKGKMPYYIPKYNSPEYRAKKKLYGLKMLYDSGLLSYLISLKAETVIVFGSFARSDWHKDSDVDIFIYGDCDFNFSKFEIKLEKELQYFQYNSESLQKISEGLLKNVLEGYFVKGGTEFMYYWENAKKKTNTRRSKRKV